MVKELFLYVCRLVFLEICTGDLPGRTNCEVSPRRIKVVCYKEVINFVNQIKVTIIIKLTKQVNNPRLFFHVHM